MTDNQTTAHFNSLTPGQAERLALLMEECGEVVQIIGKILRHGYESRHPDGGPSNRLALHSEIGDMRCAIALMCDAGDLDEDTLSTRQRAKTRRVWRYLHHQPVQEQEP